MASGSEVFSNSGATISTTEYSLTNASTTIATQTTKGCYQLVLDLHNMVSGDVYELRIYDAIVSGATQRLASYALLADAPSSPLIIIPAVMLFWGWDFTLKRTAGSDRSIGWSIRAAV